MPNTTYGSPYAQSSDLVSNWPGVSLNVADRLDDVSFKGNGLNDQTGTTYTLVLTDAGKTITLNNASAVTVTIPTNASVAFETGSTVEFTNKGAGVVTISPAGGVTLNNSTTIAQNGTVYIRKLDTNTWVMVSAPAPGLTFIASSTFTTATTVSLNNVFTSTYDWYRILVRTTASNSDAIRLRMRLSGTDATGVDYNAQYLQAVNTGVSSGQDLATTSGQIAAQNTGHNGVIVDFFSPAIATPTIWQSIIARNANASNPNQFFWAGGHNLANAYDGFTLFMATGNMTGTVRVYGYRNS